MKITRIAPVALVALASLQACVVEEADDEHDDAAFAGEWNQSYQAEEGKADGCSGVRVPDRNGFHKRVALTFDDGPNAATTPKVLDILKAHGIHATFFINGMRVKGQAERDVLARMLAEGHILANHSQEHLNLATVSQDKFDQQVQATAAIVSAAGESRKWFRFPFGSATCNELARARDHYGFTVVGWHIDTADWCFASGNGTCKKSTFKYVDDAYRGDMKAWALKQIRDNGGGISLMHDIHANTANNLEAIVGALEAEGYTFTTIDDAQTFPQLNGRAAGFIGSACKSNADCNFSANGAAGSCYAGAVCTVPCNGSCPDQEGHAPTFCVSLDGATGSCVAKSSPQNGYCAALPGTSAKDMPRFVGTSAAAKTTATVCVP